MAQCSNLPCNSCQTDAGLICAAANRDIESLVKYLHSINYSSVHPTIQVVRKGPWDRLTLVELVTYERESGDIYTPIRLNLAIRQRPEMPGKVRTGFFTISEGRLTVAAESVEGDGLGCGVDLGSSTAIGYLDKDHMRENKSPAGRKAPTQRFIHAVPDSANPLDHGDQHVR